jgi:hypothetical protein
MSRVYRPPPPLQFVVDWGQYREDIKALDTEIDALSREVESGFEVLDAQQALFLETQDAAADATQAQVEAGAQVAVADERTEKRCYVCGDTVDTTISISTPGAGPTPPACLGCMKAATDSVRQGARRQA